MSTKKEEKEQLKYESESLLRWNLCQKFAKLIYKTGISSGEIEEMINEFLNEYY